MTLTEDENNNAYLAIVNELYRVRQLVDKDPDYWKPVIRALKSVLKKLQLEYENGN